LHASLDSLVWLDSIKCKIYRELLQRPDFGK
jgi:hypothetical protein